MGMPQIPEGIHRPKDHQLVVDLLEAVALEEMATAHLMNAQGEKLQAIVHQFSRCQIDHEQLEDGCLATQGMLNTLIMNQWMLMNKMTMAIQFRDSCKHSCRPACPSPPESSTDPYETCKPCQP